MALDRAVFNDQESYDTIDFTGYSKLPFMAIKPKEVKSADNQDLFLSSFTDSELAWEFVGASSGPSSTSYASIDEVGTIYLPMLGTEVLSGVYFESPTFTGGKQAKAAPKFLSTRLTLEDARPTAETPADSRAFLASASSIAALAALTALATF